MKSMAEWTKIKVQTRVCAKDWEFPGTVAQRKEGKITVCVGVVAAVVLKVLFFFLIVIYQ